MQKVKFRDDPYAWVVRAVVVVLALLLLGVAGGWVTNKATGAEAEPQQVEQQQRARVVTCSVNGDTRCVTGKRYKRAARKFRNGDIHRDHGFRPARTFHRPRMVRRVMVGKIEAALRRADTATAMHRTDGVSTARTATEYRTAAQAAWRNMVHSATCVTTGQPSYPAQPNECRSGHEPQWTKRKVQASGAVLLCGGGVMAGIFTGGASTTVMLFGGGACAWGFWSQMDPG